MDNLNYIYYLNYYYQHLKRLNYIIKIKYYIIILKIIPTVPAGQIYGLTH